MLNYKLDGFFKFIAIFPTAFPAADKTKKFAKIYKLLYLFSTNITITNAKAGCPI